MDYITYLRDVNLVSITLRLLLAAIFAGIVGLERGQKRRPAGFRTHILVCVGATMVMITNQYMSEVMHFATDPSRMGAQVISGIGFLGAGTIIVVGRNQVKGLTTAAGLWACACMGLAIGIGFYEGAIIGCVFLLVVMTSLHSLDEYVYAHSRVMEVYVEFEDFNALSHFLEYVKNEDTKVSNLEMERMNKDNIQSVGILVTLKMSEKKDHATYLLELHKLEGVKSIEEII